jgi:hypothetical protein
MTVRAPECYEIQDGDVVLVRAGTNGTRLTEVPVVIHLEDDAIMLDVYLHDDDGHADRTVRIPIRDLEAGWNP